MSLPTPPPSATPRPAPLGQRLILGALLLLLALPALQTKWPVVPVRPLGGYTDAVALPSFSWPGLWANTYQNDLEHYLNDQLGFKPWLVRVRNQVAYSGWNELLTGGIILGKDENLYQQGPINAHFGRLYLGEREVEFRARRLRRVQDSLQAHGVQFLFLIAPGKPRMMPQYMPDSCGGGRPPGTTNYTTVCQQFAKYGVNTLDASALMLRWRDEKGTYPLFPRTGTHWSGYAVARVADTLFQRIETMTGRDLPDISHPGPPTVVTRAGDLRYTDNDLGELINLVRDIPPYPMAYPQVAIGPEQGKQRLNALIIGDSYAQSFNGFYPYFERLLTPESRYWNYNLHVAWPEQTPGESRDVPSLNLNQQLQGRHLVLMVSTEENLHRLGYEFIDQAFDVFFPLTPKDEARIAEFIAGIRQSPEWLGKVTQRAQEHNIPLEDALRQDAMFMQNRER